MKIKVKGRFYDFFNDVTINTPLASIASTFAFTAHESDVPGNAELFRPLSFHRVQFFDDDMRLLSTGTILNHRFNEEAMPDLVYFSGYSVPGVLEDSKIPPNSYPLESNGLSLEQIARKYLKYFDIPLIVYPEVAKECAEIIEKSVATPEETIKDYLCKIAAQKNVIVSHDIYGNLIMFRPKIKESPKLFLNDTNTLNISLEVNGQNMHSHYTSIRQPTKSTEDTDAFDRDYDADAGESFEDSFDKPKKKGFQIESISTIRNSLVKGYRPTVDVLSSGTFYTTTTAARNKMASELENIRISFSLNYWPKVSVGDVVEIQSVRRAIPNKVRMIIDSTVISESSDQKTMSGTLVLPETFTGETPKNIFG
jgi:prophage tail gpP-like protein